MVLNDPTLTAEKISIKVDTIGNDKISLFSLFIWVFIGFLIIKPLFMGENLMAEKWQKPKALTQLARLNLVYIF